MAVIKHFPEIKVGVSSKRMFKALFVEPCTFAPKIMPGIIKRIDLLHGNGGAGTIMHTYSPNGSLTPLVKHGIDYIDIENCLSKYTLIEGEWLDDNLKSIDFEVKFEESGDGGCVVKVVCVFNVKSDVALKEEDIQTKIDRAKEIYTATEEYLVANPNICV